MKQTGGFFDSGCSLDEGNSAPEPTLFGCDEVALVSAALNRLMSTVSSGPSSHITKQAAKVACILEIMDIFNLAFEDDRAVNNALSGMQIQYKMARRPNVQPNQSSGLSGGPEGAGKQEVQQIELVSPHYWSLKEAARRLQEKDGKPNG